MHATQSRTTSFLSASIAGGTALAAAAFSVRGPGRSGTITGLLLTARWAYCFFWPAYVGGALASTFGPKYQFLARHGRELGLAFSSAMLVHAGLVAWLYHISARPPLPLYSALYFGIGLVFVYVLAAFSVPSLATTLPPTSRRILFTVGTEYISIAFLSDFLQDPFNRGVEHLLAYFPFLTLAFFGILLRIISYTMRIRRSLPHDQNN